MEIYKKYMKKIIQRPADFSVGFHGSAEKGTAYVHALFGSGGEVISGKTRPREKRDNIKYSGMEGSKISIQTGTGIDFFLFEKN